MKEKIKTIHKEKNGAIFDIIQYQLPTEATVCLGNSRTVMRGTVALKTVTNRYKFSDQLVLTMISPKKKPLRNEHRNPSDWNTIEFYVPLTDAEALLQKALDLVQAKLGTQKLHHFLG